MGASPDNLDIIADLHRRGYLPTGANIADLGCTQLRGATADDVRRFLLYFGKTPSNEEVAHLAAHNTFVTEHFKAVGFGYRAFDIVEAPDCEYFDLNTDLVPTPHLGKFDLILNFGTTEHVLNQLNALRTLHDLAKPNGLIYSLFLRGGYMDHGLLHYSDRFTDLLCEANGYEQIWRSDQSDPGTQCTWIVLRKTGGEPFAPPIDVQLGEGFPQMVARPKKKSRLAGLFG
jgi:SAM-dependent methyltransferase